MTINIQINNINTSKTNMKVPIQINYIDNIMKREID